MLISRKTIEKAADRIKPYIKNTYLERSHFFSKYIEGDVWFKLENLQVTGSFKARGAMNKVLCLSKKERLRGIVSASTGNHGAAVAYAARQLDIRCNLFVPQNSSDAKVANMENFGANIKFHGKDSVEAEYKAREFSIANGGTYISPYNDKDVIAGQGTIGKEIFDEYDSLDAMVISVGGGGLIGGVATFLKSCSPNMLVIGCSPENSAVMLRSMEAGKILNIESKPTISDGTAGGVEKGAITFDICCDTIDQTVFLEEAEIKDAMLLYIKNERKLLEGAAGTAIAALIKKKKELAGKKVGIIICGGNISIDDLKSVIH